MSNLDTKIEKAEKHVEELKAKKTKQNADPKDEEIAFLKGVLRKYGIKPIANNDHGNSLDFNFDFQLEKGKQDHKKGIYHDFDEKKNHWTLAQEGNLYDDVIDGGIYKDMDNAMASEDEDDDDDEDSDGYVNHIFW